jgi:hypothetical protein
MFFGGNAGESIRAFSCSDFCSDLAGSSPHPAATSDTSKVCATVEFLESELNRGYLEKAYLMPVTQEVASSSLVGPAISSNKNRLISGAFHRQLIMAMRRVFPADHFAKYK